MRSTTVQQKLDSERKENKLNDANQCFDPYEQCKESGAKVKVFWERNELGSTVGSDGWSVGWYNARVISYDEEDDTIDLEYIKEPGSVYSIDFSMYFSTGKLKLVSSPLSSKGKKTV